MLQIYFIFQRLQYNSEELTIVKDLKRLNKYFLKYKYYLLLGIVFLTISNLFAVYPARVIGNATKFIVENISTQLSSQQAISYEQISFEVIKFGLIILAMALTKGLFQFLTRQTIIIMSRHIEYDQKNEIYDHYQKLPLSFYRSNNTGDLMNRISEDVSKVRMYVGPAVMYGLNFLVTFIAVIVFMLMVNTELTLYTLLPLPILSISVYYVSNKMNVQSDLIQKSQSGLSTFVQEAFSGIRVLKAFVREDKSAHTFAEKSEKYKKESLKLSMTHALFFPLIILLIGASTVLTVFIGTKLVMEGQIHVGNITEFVIYVNMLTWPVTSLGWITSIIQSAAASQSRINEFLDVTPDIVSDKNVTQPLEGNIRFENVSLTYPDSGITAVDNISFEVKKGQSVAFIGNTGSGKSTIAHLIARLYDTTSGNIFIDDINIKDLNLQHYRSQIGFVPQDSFLFSDSIKNNISFGTESVAMKEIIEASKLADVYENIERFEHKFETVIGERGITLSGGQKQRLTLARALIRDPQLLILDDSLSAIDTKTEDKILDNLKTVMRNRSSIIISHRASSVKLADHIIVINEGKISEQGSHEELISLNGEYKELYDMQLEEN